MEIYGLSMDYGSWENQERKWDLKLENIMGGKVNKHTIHNSSIKAIKLKDCRKIEKDSPLVTFWLKNL
jgi:hypothetical protein